jgi:hypothetical protein
VEPCYSPRAPSPRFLAPPRPSPEPRSPKVTSEPALPHLPPPLPSTPSPRLPPLPLVRSPPNSSTRTPSRPLRPRRKKTVPSTPSVPRLAPPRRRTTYVRPRRNPPYPALRRLWLALLRRVHHQASCSLCRRRHLLLIRRTFAPPLKNLLRHLSIHTFLQSAYRTRRRSTRTNSSSSNLTDNKFGDLLVKARSHLF